MKRQKIILLLVALMLMAGTAGALTWFRANQKLGKPGIRATPLPGSAQMKINLPEQVLDYTSTNVPEPAEVAGYLPKDTSYAERFYTAPDGLMIEAAVVMMGADRTSIHRPEYCLPGHGWTINEKKTDTLTIEDHPSYQLQIARWNLTDTLQQPDGQKVNVSGVYVFWFLADNEETMSHDQMLEWLTMDLFRTGALQRWAYVLFFAECPPGQEGATYEKIKRLIIASAPKFEMPLKQK